MNSALQDLMELLDSRRVQRARDPHGVVSFRMFVVLVAEVLARGPTAMAAMPTDDTPPAGVPILAAFPASGPTLPSPVVGARREDQRLSRRDAPDLLDPPGRATVTPPRGTNAPAPDDAHHELSGVGAAARAGEPSAETNRAQAVDP